MRRPMMTTTTVIVVLLGIYLVTLGPLVAWGDHLSQSDTPRAAKPRAVSALPQCDIADHPLDGLAPPTDTPGTPPVFATDPRTAVIPEPAAGLLVVLGVMVLRPGRRGARWR